MSSIALVSSIKSLSVSSSMGSGNFMNSNSHVSLLTVAIAPSANSNVYVACPHLKLLIARVSYSNAAEILKSVYNNIENYYYTIINLQSGFGQYMTLFPEIEDDNGQKTVYTYLYDKYLKSQIDNGVNVELEVYDLGNYLKSFDSVNSTNEFDKFRDTYSQIPIYVYVLLIILTSSL